ncbi:Uu.00g052000.m01.CDS01 [Anthostomella pinea]|uniref:Uu.00g052000.m01.CDS01 n=1 Tax=Anthostomella pinea TaxID=933095 RepID=A0AAI8YPF6_9PEZI|nr:Uu.00g052000.m01.CDS01 [Anthostomella pinea]
MNDHGSTIVVSNTTDLLSSKKSNDVYIPPTTTRCLPGKASQQPAQHNSSYNWRIWRHAKTRLGCVVAMLFSGEAFVGLVAGSLLTTLLDESFRRNGPVGPAEVFVVNRDGIFHSIEDGGQMPGLDLDTTRIVPRPYSHAPFLYTILLQCLIVAAVSSVWALPRDKYGHLPPVVYGSMLLHREQVRAGPTHRKCILAAKIVLLVLSVAVLWIWAGMPAVHRANLGADLRYISSVGSSTEQTSTFLFSIRTLVFGYALLVFDALAAAWAYAACAVMAAVVAMNLLVCFAWSPTPDMFTVAELRALARAEEARRQKIDGGGAGYWADEEAVDLAPLGVVWRVQEALAGLGERMVVFAGRTC